jgi:hypothetical protein
MPGPKKAVLKVGKNKYSDVDLTNALYDIKE